MVFRRKYPKRKPRKGGRRKTYRKKSALKKGDEVYRKFKLIQALTASGAGAIDKYYYLNSVGTTNFATYANLYEEYRVCAFKWKFLPGWTVDEEGSLLTAKQVPLITLVDFNYSAATSFTQQAAIFHESAKFKPFLNQGLMQSRYVRIPKRPLITDGTPSTFTQESGWQATEAAGNTTGVFIVTTGTDVAPFVASSEVGTVEITWYVKLRHARA